MVKADQQRKEAEVKLERIRTAAEKEQREHKDLKLAKEREQDKLAKEHED